MGVITLENVNHKKADNLYAKIKREFKSYNLAGLIDENDFHSYTADVLKELGNSVLKEEQAILRVKNGKAQLPSDFKTLHAAYKCNITDQSLDCNTDHLQNSQVYYTDVTCDVLCRLTGCNVDCCEDEKLIQRVTVKQYVKEGVLSTHYSTPSLLRLSPTSRPLCVENCINMRSNSQSEISINNGYFFTNFNDGDIYIQYYAFPLDENNTPMIPDIPEVEQAIEWYIKWQLLLRFWLNGDVADVVNKWQKAEAMFLKYMGDARFINKLPSFAKIVDSMRNGRSINKVNAFSRMDNKRY